MPGLPGPVGHRQARTDPGRLLPGAPGAPGSLCRGAFPAPGGSGVPVGHRGRRRRLLPNLVEAFAKRSSWGIQGEGTVSPDAEGVLRQGLPIRIRGLRPGAVRNGQFQARTGHGGLGAARSGLEADPESLPMVGQGFGREGQGFTGGHQEPGGVGPHPLGTRLPGSRVRGHQGQVVGRRRPPWRFVHQFPGNRGIVPHGEHQVPALAGRRTQDRQCRVHQGRGSPAAPVNDR